MGVMGNAASTGMATGGAMGAAAAGSAAGGLVGAGIGAVIGAIIGGVSYTFDFYEQKHKLNDAIDDLEEQRDNYLKLLDNKYTVDKVNSLNAADEKDKQADYAEQSLDRDINSQMKQLESQGYLQALGYNQQAQQAGQQTGAELATQATSGTRGSTANQAIDFESKNAETMLQASQTAARDESDYNLQRLIYSYMDSRQQIQSTRTDAYNNRATFAQTGEDYRGGIKYRANGMSYTAYKIQRDYDEAQYNKQIEAIKKQKRDMSSAWGFWSGMAKSIIGGSSSGVSIGQNIGTTSGTLWSNLNYGNTGSSS